MPRPPAPCGTYPAYRRHLRNGESVDAACRRAQRNHDADRSSARDREPREPVVIPSRPKSLEDVAEDLRLQILAKAHALVAAVEDDHFYNVVDEYDAMEELIEAWAVAGNDVNAANGWPHLSEELRAKLMAAEEAR